MSISRSAKAPEHVDDDPISEAAANKRTKKKPWVRWGAIAACLCLAAVGVLTLQKPAKEQDYAQNVVYRDARLIICGPGEAEILKKCGLPSEITAELAGESLGSFKAAEKNSYYTANEGETASAELFAYAPQPNDNVYIVRIEGAHLEEGYYAAIRKDSEGYHGLNE